MARDCDSIRSLSARTGISREVLRREIAEGRLRAAQLGPRRYMVLRQDFEQWIASRVIRPSAGVAARVEQVLAREMRTSRNA